MTLSFTQSFYVSQVEDYREKLKLSYRPLAFTSYKALLKNKKGLELVYIQLPDQISSSGCFYFMRYWRICVF